MEPSMLLEVYYFTDYSSIASKAASIHDHNIRSIPVYTFV